PYAIDFMNPAPDAEIASVGEYNHNWIVNAMTDFIFKKLESGFETPDYKWSAMLNPPVKAVKKRATKTKTVEKKAQSKKAAGSK
ncbi:MAG: hypothetical protein M3449_02435, partial [Acidobacteriota bacterium]|nr:hypothetical protein [Acidobacteriota bacterium]